MRCSAGIACLLLSCLVTFHARAEDAPADVQQAANQGLTSFLAKIQPGTGELYGLREGESFDGAALGKPFRLHTIRPDSLLNAKPGDSVTNLISQTPVWYFPVMLGADTRAILVVDRAGDSWQAVSFGMAPIARELGAVRRQWPEAKGFHPKLVAVFQARQFLFTIPEKGDRNLTRVKASRPKQAGGKAAETQDENEDGDYALLGAAGDVIEALKPAVAQSLLEGSGSGQR